ncbi:MAG TPA: YIP1 family protein [Longimicrobium sp.]|nr:YIP1 family protein [Longimicrobium sp.]
MTASSLDTAAAPPEAPAARPAARPLPVRVADTFFSPGKLFAELRDAGEAGERAWLGPVLVSLVVLLALTLATPLFFTPLEVAEFARQQAVDAGRQNLPPAEQMAGQMEVFRWVGTAFFAAWTFARPFVVGALLAGIFGAFFGGNAKYRMYVSVASHAFLVSALGALVGSALMFASGRLDVALSLAVLAPDAGGVARGVLNALTPFSLWMTALFAYGAATVNRREGWIGAAVILLALQVAVAAAMAALGGMGG